MRLLHVGSGFRPMRGGGLVAYIEDLMSEQARRGHEVAYFLSGRQYPFVSGPRMRRWQAGPIAMFEVVNSPLYDHGRQPELEIAEPRIERMFARALDQLQPDVVHVQELAGLPTSLLELIRSAGIPQVVTLQDYFPLCSTFKLLDADGRVCLRREVGADCMRTTAADTRDPGILFVNTVVYELRRVPLVRRLPLQFREDWIWRIAYRLAGTEIAHRDRRSPRTVSPSAFQLRRDVNVERLNGADRVIAMSNRVAEIYARLGVEEDRLEALQLTLGHIERLRPRPTPRREGRLTFATLAGFESMAKGSQLLLDAVRLLCDRGLEERFRFVVLGGIDPSAADEARAIPAFEVRGRYLPEELDSILDEVDVGVMSSIWEEAYGYAGVEFLAKGIPVIANAIGGMVDYTREGETGWLNRSCSAPELADIMAGIVERPEEVAELSAKVRAARATIVKPLARHADEMDEIYAAVT